MKYEIMTVGFPMVEMVRRQRGVPFNEVGDFYGPYPSADTCIMLDVAARLGKKCCYLGRVGSDNFGKIVINRMESDGIEVSHVRVAKDSYTPVIFVRYDLDGTREYLEVINNSACFSFNPDDIDSDLVSQSAWIHLSGEVIGMCTNGDMRKAIEKFLYHISPESKVSLDPNFVEDITSMVDFYKPFVDRADLILPSEGEARMLMGTQTDDEACRLLSDKGKIIALKRGANGCTIYSDGDTIKVPSFHIAEVDPTGCGDSFCAGFITGLIEEWPLEEVGRFANATGALQATVIGPMEGAMYMQEVLDFIEKNSA